MILLFMVICEQKCLSKIEQGIIDHEEFIPYGKELREKHIFSAKSFDIIKDVPHSLQSLIKMLDS
jgi:hypothetical protein